MWERSKCSDALIELRLIATLSKKVPRRLFHSSHSSPAIARLKRFYPHNPRHLASPISTESGEERRLCAFSVSSFTLSGMEKQCEA
ncbi:hypothetical protein BDZ91DRAFT_739465 [Kalaharituber pfeilii]|nr:hypothetical protein BDZ91DRAFT_739465 [Kalaharituber pfeilii]